MLVPAIVPNNYDVTFVKGRQQPFTIWYLRPEKKFRKETVAFCESWGQALRRIVDDCPDEAFDTEL